MKRRRATATAQDPGRERPGAGLAPAAAHKAWTPPALPPWALLVGLVAALAVLLIHVRIYDFLTDDAFISFRYVRNFSHGFGLVFNPGHEPVEGYSNFLWVLILAAFDKVGLVPERTANVLSIAMTVALWALVVWFAWRTHREPRLSWAILVPAWCFAVTRSLAVWATSGLETRLFELCVIGGALRLVVELEALRAGERRRTVSPWLFALGALTRPDGVLLAFCAFAAALVVVWKDRREALIRSVAGWIPFGLVIGAQFAFRRAYYHQWFPNTYYAKAEGLQWWDSGGRYLSAFALEYAAYLWVPLLAGAVVYRLRRRTGFVPALFAAMIVPHVVYIAAIGGDHFEYRPLDLYLPLLFLLFADGVREWSDRRRLAAIAPVYMGLVLVGLVALPWQTHRQFVNHYLPGFPGWPDSTEAARGAYLLPENDPIYRLPGLRSIASAYRERLVTMSTQFVAIRQEEHRLFLATGIPDGRRLRAMIERGMLPRDVYVAMDCVGAIPYYSDVRTLDRLGLTDAHIAHSRSVRKIMAHSKSATMDYARGRGVDLWNIDPVHTLVPLTSKSLLTIITEMGSKILPEDTVFSADAGDNYVVLAKLPQGRAAARARFPRLHFESLSDSSFLRGFVAKSIPAYEALRRRNPDDLGAVHRMAFLCVLGQRYGEALTIYQYLDRADPDNPGVVEKIALCQEVLGDTASAEQSLERAYALAEASGNERIATRVALRAQWLRTPGARRGAAPLRQGAPGQ